MLINWTGHPGVSFQRVWMEPLFIIIIITTIIIITIIIITVITKIIIISAHQLDLTPWCLSPKSVGPLEQGLLGLDGAAVLLLW